MPREPFSGENTGWLRETSLYPSLPLEAVPNATLVTKALPLCEGLGTAESLEARRLVYDRGGYSAGLLVYPLVHSWAFGYRYSDLSSSGFLHVFTIVVLLLCMCS